MYIFDENGTTKFTIRDFFEEDEWYNDGFIKTNGFGLFRYKFIDNKLFIEKCETDEVDVLEWTYLMICPWDCMYYFSVGLDLSLEIGKSRNALVASRN